MTVDIPFSKKGIRKKSLLMLDCPTRKSIISTVAYMKKHGLKEYNNMKWIITRRDYLQYQVIDKATKTAYFVIDYEDTWLGESGFGVYKKEAE